MKKVKMVGLISVALMLLSTGFIYGDNFVANAQSASDALTLWGGPGVDNAGELKVDGLGKKHTLKDNLTKGQKIYVLLPELKPGQGFSVKVKNSEKAVTFNSDGSLGTNIYAKVKVSVVDEEDSGKFCDAGYISGVKQIAYCRVSEVSSDKEKYNLYLVVEGDGLDSNNGTSKDVEITVDRFDHYDSALKTGDVTNEIRNALAIEPGKYEGWVGSMDLNDYYKLDGLGNGAEVSINLEVLPDNNPSSPVDTYASIWLKVYDENRKEISLSSSSLYGRGMRVKLNEVGQGSFSVKLDNLDKDGLTNKVSRYIQLDGDCTIGCQKGLSINYLLSLEVKGNVSQQTSGGAGANCGGFKDVSSNDNRCAAVANVKSKGIMNGTGDGSKFEGTLILNRAAFAAVMLRFKGEQNDDNNSLGDLVKFKDIGEKDKGQWFIGILRRAMAVGLLSGFPDSTMRPADPVNRAQFVVIFAKAAGVTLPKVTSSPANDVSASSDATTWYRAAVKFVVDEKLVDLDSSRNFYPNNAITRYEVADIINRWQNKK